MYCKLPTNGMQLPAFPLKAVTGIEPRPQRWEARVLPLCHRGPYSPSKCTDKILFEKFGWRSLLRQARYENKGQTSLVQGQAILKVKVKQAEGTSPWNTNVLKAMGKVRPSNQWLLSAYVWLELQDGGKPSDRVVNLFYKWPIERGIAR